MPWQGAKHDGKAEQVRDQGRVEERHRRKYRGQRDQCHFPFGGDFLPPGSRFLIYPAIDDMPFGASFGRVE
jgi:hypothetical protein